MARVFLLIDGYNLLHAAGLGRRRFARGGLELARTKLLQKLATELADEVCRDTVVVFDAAADADARNQQQQSPTPESGWPFSVTFSAGTQSADDEIERLLSLHSSPRQVLVVSSDHRLHRAASRRGATGIDSDHFLTLLESGSRLIDIPLPQIPQNRQKPTARSPRTPGRQSSPGQPSDKPKSSQENMSDLREELLSMDLEHLLQLDLPPWNPPQPKNTRRRKS
ncbi:MAG: hypothetical protein RIT02_414 [Planctomycetota bacterium]|jgi:predicted RNA-binding protein with PIN domain